MGRRISQVDDTTPLLRPQSAPDRHDLSTFVGRILRLAPTSAVRLQRHPADGDRTLAWGVVLGVLIRREFRAALVGVADITVLAGELDRQVSESTSRSDTVSLPAAVDSRWRATLPPSAGWRHREDLPAADVLSAIDTSAASLKEADAVMLNAAGEAMLGMAVITVRDDTGAEPPLELPLRLVLAATRMGFLASVTATHEVIVRIASTGPWTALATPNGAVFKRTSPIDLLTIT